MITISEDGEAKAFTDYEEIRERIGLDAVQMEWVKLGAMLPKPILLDGKEYFEYWEMVDWELNKFPDSLDYVIHLENA